MALKKSSAPRGKIRLLVADDHAIVRFGLSTLFQYEDDIDLVAEAEDGETAVRLAVKRRPDVAVVDLAMPGLGGLEAIRRIRASAPATKVIVFTSFGASHELAAAIEAGVAGIVLKDAGNDALLAAIRAVAAGKTAIPNDLRRAAETASAVPLTPQERELLAATARGLTNPEIAVVTGLSKDVVKHQLSDLFAKLGVATRAEAVALALREKLI